MEQVLKELQKELKSDLISVIRFGSQGKRSNLLVVTAQLDYGTLRDMKSALVKFTKRTGTLPVLATTEELKDSCDVFPLELIDIKHPHEVLFGEDVLAALVFKKAEIRRAIEYTLRSKLIGLRSAYILATSKQELRALLKSAVPELMPLFTGLISLKKSKVPVTLTALYAEVEKMYGLDMGIFQRIEKGMIPDHRIESGIKEVTVLLETLINRIDKL